MFTQLFGSKIVKVPLRTYPIRKGTSPKGLGRDHLIISIQRGTRMMWRVVFRRDWEGVCPVLKARLPRILRNGCGWKIYLMNRSHIKMQKNIRKI